VTASNSARESDQVVPLLQAAIEQVAHRGYDGVRLRDIAVAAGVSIGSLQHRFLTRERLLARACEHHCGELLESWSRIARAADDPWRRIEMLIEQLSESPALDRRAAVWTEFSANAARRPQLREPLRRVHDAWRSLVLDAVREGTRWGRFRPVVGEREAVDLLHATIDGALVAMAGDARHMDGRRLRELALTAAALALGVGPAHGSAAAASS
jgi:AcrR family transcriptional regulator